MGVETESGEAFGKKDEDSEEHKFKPRRRKLILEQVFEIRRRMKAGEFHSYASCGREYGVSRWMIAKICHGTRWGTRREQN